MIVDDDVANPLGVRAEAGDDQVPIWPWVVDDLEDDEASPACGSAEVFEHQEPGTEEEAESGSV